MLEGLKEIQLKNSMLDGIKQVHSNHSLEHTAQLSVTEESHGCLVQRLAKTLENPSELDMNFYLFGTVNSLDIKEQVCQL